MKNKSCREIQEALASEKALSPEAQNHVLDCSACTAVSEEITELHALILEGTEDFVPEGFADRVMARVLTDSKQELSLRPFLLRTEALWLRWASVAGAIVIAGHHLVRFVLAPILISGAGNLG